MPLRAGNANIALVCSPSSTAVSSTKGASIEVSWRLSNIDSRLGLKALEESELWRYRTSEDERAQAADVAARLELCASDARARSVNAHSAPRWVARVTNGCNE